MHYTAPYGSSKANASYDMLMMATAFDFDVSIAFFDDGIFQLVKNQESQVIAEKNLAKQLKSLEIFTISNIYIEKNSLHKRGLTQSDLIIQAKIITNNKLGDIMRQQDYIIRI